MLPLLQTLSPNAALLILSLGVALIALEFNRPGSIAPGSIGLLLTLLAAAALSHRHPSPAAAAGSLASMALFLFQARRPLHWFVIVALMILLVGCFIRLIPPSTGEPVSMPVAILCGVFLAAGTTLLTRIARSARQNKGLD